MARLLAAAPIALTVMPLSRSGRGWVRIWDFPRAQIATLGLTAAVVMARRSRRTRLDLALAGGCWASVLYQTAKMVPYTRLYPRQVPTGRDVESARRIRLLMANVLQENRRSDLVLRAIGEADPDVVALVETNHWWVDAMRPLATDYPWVHSVPLENHYGMTLYSRLPIAACDVRFVVTPDVPSLRATLQLRSGDDITVYVVHPPPPVPDTPSYGRDAELVLTGLEIRRDGRPSIIIGDLNDVAWSYTTTLFQRLSRMVDPRVGRGMFNTFHAEHPLARYPLDHVFHTTHFTVRSLRRLPYTGSDHFPIVVELAYEAAEASRIAHPEPTGADLDNAREMVDDVQAGSHA